MPLLRAFPSFVLALGAASLTGSGFAQQALSPAAAFAKARSTYYTPVDQGLQGFTCGATFNWRQFIEQANHAPVAGDDARLRYLKSIHLSITDDLHGVGALQWAAPTTAPDGTEESVTEMRTGMQALVAGFFQTWNGFYTGDLVTLDRAANIERTPTGFRLFTRSASGQVAEEVFGSDLALRSLHVSTMQYDSLLSPQFQVTAQGRVLRHLTSVIKQPPTAAGTTIEMDVQYAPVDGFQLPSELRLDVPGSANFDFQLSGCTVRLRTGASGSKTP